MRQKLGKFFRRLFDFLTKKSGLSLKIEKKTTVVKIKPRKD